MDKKPFIMEETENFAVVFKPPKMHCEPIKKIDSCTEGMNTLCEWYENRVHSFCEMMHRIDFETHGLVLFAKNKKSFEYFKNLQGKGEFVKEYSAITNSAVCISAGFPSPPVFKKKLSLIDEQLVIESYFRPYGKGRKLVRPVIENKRNRDITKDRGGFYQTEIIRISAGNFTVRIKRGFRHQIRCHLCWIGFPILNDPLYSHPPMNVDIKPGDFLALRAHALFFTDPSNGSKLDYRIEALEKMPT